MAFYRLGHCCAWNFFTFSMWSWRPECNKEFVLLRFGRLAPLKRQIYGYLLN
jgi:hypothetical protein